MPDTSRITHFTLKIIFAVHLILTTWGLQGHWCPQSVLFYNLLFFGCLMWAIHHSESDEPLQIALLINVLSILLDVITLAINFRNDYAPERFSGAMMIINTIVRLITTKYLLKIGQMRGGTLAELFPPGPNFVRQEYEDISHPVPQNNDFTGI